MMEAAFRPIAELVLGDVGKAVQQLERESDKGLLVGGVKLPIGSSTVISTSRVISTARRAPGVPSPHSI
jgi:hypothetical protein